MARPLEQPKTTDTEHHSSGLVWFQEAFFDQGLPGAAKSDGSDRPDRGADNGAAGLGGPDGPDRLAQSIVRGRLFGESDTTQVGRFVVLDKLGEGGMGIVYSAYDKELDRKVAVKLLRRTDGGEDGHRRMQREAQAMARLSHPNVVQVYEVGFYEGQLFVVMEFVEGQTLRTWCRAKSRRWQEVVRVFSEAGRGLAAAHHAGLVHRDFKPENVLIGDDGRVRVLDFGLARAHEVDDAPTGPDAGVFELSEIAENDASASSSAFASRLTRSGTVLGTPAYMSPEQHMRQPADARSDQFSLCVALHEALAGERPFDEDNRAVLVFAKQTGQVREWPRERTKVPKWLRRAIGRGLSPHPVERWPSMAPLLAELGRVRVGTRRRWLWVGLAVMAVASVVGFGVAKSWAAQSELCSGSEAERSRLWSVPRQGRVRVAMTLADPTVAEQAWPAVSEGVQAYTDEWVAVHREACEATNLRREQSRHLYNLQLQCLERRRGQLDALLDVLENSKIKMVADAAGAVDALAPVSDCGDRKRLQSSNMRLLALEDPDAKSTVRELRDSLDHVFSLTTVGRPDEARTLLATALARTKEVGYRPLLAEAEYARGLLEMSVGKDMEAAERALKEALWIAEEVRHDRISARAMAKFLRLVGIDQGRRDEAMRHVRHAEAILRRSDLSKGAHQELLESLSNLIYDDETTEAGTGGVQEAFERAYTREKVRSPDQLSVTSSLRSLGEELVEEGELEKAVEHYARALEVARGQAGEDSPDVALLLGRLGNVHYELGDFRRAARTYLQAHRVYAGLVDPADARRVQMQLRLAEVSTARRDFRKAGGYLLRVKRSGTRDPALLAEQRMLAAELLLARGRTKQANRAFEGLLRQLSKLPDAAVPERAQLKELNESADGAGARNRWLRVRAQAGHGETLLVRGDAERAALAFKHSLESGEKFSSSAPRGLLPRIRFGLARSLWAQDGGDDGSRFVAIGHARKAARGYEDLRGRYLVALAEVEAWLQSRAE